MIRPSHLLLECVAVATSSGALLVAFLSQSTRTSEPWSSTLPIALAVILILVELFRMGRALWFGGALWTDAPRRKDVTLRGREPVSIAHYRPDRRIGLELWAVNRQPRFGQSAILFGVRRVSGTAGDEWSALGHSAAPWWLRGKARRPKPVVLASLCAGEEYEVRATLEGSPESAVTVTVHWAPTLLLGPGEIVG